MFLILAHSDDETAKLVHASLLKRHGTRSVRYLTVEELIHRASWSYQDTAMGVRTSLRLADQSRLHSSNISAVFNRTRFVSMPQFGSTVAADYDYAVMEMRALLLSWLQSLGPRVVNRASVRGLGGAERSLPEWLLLAGRAGLPARALHLTTDSGRFPAGRHYTPYKLSSIEGALAHQALLEPLKRATLGQEPALFLEGVEDEGCRVVVAGKRITTAPVAGWPEELNRGCLRLARLSGCAILECSFARSSAATSERSAATPEATAPWRFCAANPFADARSESEVESIVLLLEEQALRAGRESESE